MHKNYAKGGGRYATERTRRMGTNAEILFEQILYSHGIPYSSATKKEELINHYDYIASQFVNFTNCKVEVKSTKSPKRGKKPDPSILFIELKSVGGHPGWLYGKSDVIAFQINSHFIIFKRMELLEYVEKMIPNMFISKRGGLKGTLYQRRNRKDLVAIFDTKIVMENVPFIFLYKKKKLMNITYAQVVKN